MILAVFPTCYITTLHKEGKPTRFKVAARSAHDSRIYLGTYPSYEEAQAAFDRYKLTGQVLLSKRGPKAGSRQSPRAMSLCRRCGENQLYCQCRRRTAARSRIEMMKIVLRRIEA